MADYYYIGTAKIIGADRLILVKTESGYLSEGNIVLVNTGVLRTSAEVICTSMVKRGSKDEAIMNSIEPAYEVDKIYHMYWENKEEENTDGTEELE